MKRWSKTEIDALYNIKTKEDIKIIAKQINRSEATVGCKSIKLGIYTYNPIEIYHDKYPISIKAYLSGHFDGEGCIRTKKKYSGSLRYRLSVSVSSANRESLEMYKKYFNGGINTKKHFTNKPMYLWHTSNINDVYNFINSVLPFSIEKKSS